MIIEKFTSHLLKNVWLHWKEHFLPLITFPKEKLLPTLNVYEKWTANIVVNNKKNPISPKGNFDCNEVIENCISRFYHIWIISDLNTFFSNLIRLNPYNVQI